MNALSSKSPEWIQVEWIKNWERWYPNWSEMDLEIYRAYTATKNAGLEKPANGIRQLAELIRSDDLYDFFHSEKGLLLQSQLSRFLKNITQWVDQLKYAPSSSRRDYHDSPEELQLRSSVENAIQLLREILEKIGSGELTLLHQAISESARQFLRHFRKVIRIVCGSLSSLGLSSDQCWQHHFRKYLIPEPRGELYANS
ncbi:MAG: hypothetical protein EOP09_00350 [Proteobacteria bacterium]|nr:MAG: hypothetical protein EOP09_00350 [Pseudomonadota bacterium]